MRRTLVSGRVLIVEDETDVGAVLALALRREGCEVQVVESVAQAQEFFTPKATDAPIDVLIVDWHIQDGTAEPVCVAARSIAPEIPVIMMSGIEHYQSGAIHQCNPVLFLPKPINIDVLRNSVRTLLMKK